MPIPLTHDFTPIIEMLAFAGDKNRVRNSLVLAGTENWQEQVVQHIFEGYKMDVLWITDKVQSYFPSSTIKKAKSWLGQEKKIVVFDANNFLEPDSFAAVSGIVTGGGFFILLLPEKRRWNDTYASTFGQRFIACLNMTEDTLIIDEFDAEIDYKKNKVNTQSKKECNRPYLSRDQQIAVEIIYKNITATKQATIVLQSDRGRGKSATLGFTIALLLKKGIKNIAITAPRLRSLDIVFKHIAEQLPEAEIESNRVGYNNSLVNFYSPDQLLKEAPSADMLFIDEAAAIPVTMLTQFLSCYPQCVFATTVHGYEGTGRGFALRFVKELNKFDPDWIKLEMTEPVRWPMHDSLEKWVNKLLCLDVELLDLANKNICNKIDLQYKIFDKCQLKDNHTLLSEIFSLLIFSHYRTRPSDLKSLFDDDLLTIYVALHDNHVVAVALTVAEGGFDKALSTDIYQGKRRPKGNLLAQALTYHCGVEHAATLNYARVMRIAVHPELQNIGIGTELLNIVVDAEKNKGCDAIGTSYGMTLELLRFWKRSNFDVVRIGFTREQTSGEHAAIMLYSLSSEGKKVFNESVNRFKRQGYLWFQDILSAIPRSIQEQLELSDNTGGKLTEQDVKDLQSFIKYSRNYELCIGAVNKFVQINKKQTALTSFPEDFRIILQSKIETKNNWSEIARSMNLTGKKEARVLFHQAVYYLFDVGS